MAHHLVEGDGLSTRYAFAPRVTTRTEGAGPDTVLVEEGPTHLQLEFSSSAVSGPPPQEVRVTRLNFEHVVEYTWNDFEFGRVPYCPEDGALALIEIENSPAVAELRATGRYIGNDLRHYRITFDDHGTYDVVCEGLTVTYHTVQA